MPRRRPPHGLPLLAALAALVAIPCLGFELRSADIVDGAALPRAQVYDREGCHGANLSPQLSWRDAPAGTRSFAVTVFDPDASGGWWHWVVFDLPAGTAGLARGALAAEPARQAVNDFGSRGYGGACPPPGDRPHRYVFTVHALGKLRLDLADGVPAAQAAARIEAAAIGHASLTATYGR
jgi:Raf kinase inhibitor-like YbhB/YbcL family protein